MSTSGSRSLPPSISKVRRLDPALAEELSGDFERLSLAAGAVAWAQSHLEALLAAPSEPALLATVVGAARELTGAPRAWALTWTGDLSRGRASFEAVAGDGVDLHAPPEVSRTVLGTVAAEGRPAWADDAQEDARFQAAESVQAFSLRSVGCVPVGRTGALWLEDPDRPGRFDLGARLRVGALCSLAGRILAARRDPAAVAAPAAGVEPVPGLVGDTPAMHALFASIRAFAPMPWPALILGETGTGKEAVARALHALSPRADAPFVPVNCGAIVSTLAESTLFGHERGAFTGADRRKEGLLSQVGRGTLFLDEVGELSPELQVKLLRVLQEGTFQRVGGRDTLKFHGRVVAATHRPLDDAARRGDFREDLFFRLAAGIIRVPPLRDRRADVPALARHLLGRALDELPPGVVPRGAGFSLSDVGLDPDALSELSGRAWSGNVRELENVLRGALARCLASGRARLAAADLAPAIALAPSQDGAQAPASVAPVAPVAPPPAAGLFPDDPDLDLKAATEAFQQWRIQAALDESGGNRSAAARSLGVSRQWLHRLLSRWEEG